MERVEFSLAEECRRAVVAALEEAGIPRRPAGVAASRVVDRVRAAGLLHGDVERHYSARQVAELLGRSPAFVVGLIRAGALRPVYRDGGGWMIPASAVNTWLAGVAYGLPEMGCGLNETGFSVNRTRAVGTPKLVVG